MTFIEAPPQEAPVESTAVIPNTEPVQKKRPYLAYVATGWLVLIVAASLLAPLLPIGSIGEPIGAPKQRPFSLGGIEGLLGTDDLGRSVLSRVVNCARASLLVGAAAGLIGFAVGMLLGLMAGYFRGKVDVIITIVADAMLAFPPLVLLLALSSVLTPSITTLMIGLTFLVVPSFIRLARANTMAWASREFITAARNMGASNFRILSRELLPNVFLPLATFLPIVIAALIVAEGSLSFLGLGIPPPTPSWGGMISAGQSSLEQDPHLVFIPALFIFLTVLSLNSVGDQLRSRFEASDRH